MTSTRLTNKYRTNMKKEEYTKLINDKPWNWIKEHFDVLETYTPKKIAHCEIDQDKWIKFSVDYFDQAQHNYELPKDHYNDFAKKLSTTNNQLGRNIHNSSELNYGVEGDTNQIMIDMFGEENRKKLGLRSDYLFFRLIVKMPGHGVAWHVDHIGSYTQKFQNELEIDHHTQKCQLGQIVRLWFPVTDWDNGHSFQVSETVLSNWQAGDVYKIPFGMGHCSANAGYVPQMTVALTGIIGQ
jgi:hypothetical protein